MMLNPCGFYYSSTLDSNNPYNYPYNVPVLFFSSSDKGLSADNRAFGLSVRPVYKKNEIYSINVNKTGISVSTESSYKSFDLTSNDTWVVSSNVNWITLSALSGSGDKSITLNVCENSSGSSRRTGTITISGARSGTKTIIVTQEGNPYCSSINVDGYENGYAYVDLGLPSGLLWATYNVGSQKEEDYGYYFQWGETTTNTIYDNSTYKHYESSLSSSLTKYCTSSRYGTVDNKTVLELEDDAASVNWGGNWRMPTKAEFDELIDTNNCEWIWTKQNGVNGCVVISKKNNNYIFLPAAGYYDVSNITAGRGYYLSSSLSSSGDHYASAINFGIGYTGDFFVSWIGGPRYRGLSVRSVFKPSK